MTNGSNHVGSPRPARRKRNAGIAFAVGVLAGGTIAAACDVTLMRRAFEIARAMAGTAEGIDPPVTHVTITWFHGLVNLGQVDHPLFWAGLGGFLYGALISALVLLGLYGLVASIRQIARLKSNNQVQA